MIELSADQVVWAHQGGYYMFPLSASDQEQSTLAHVWAHLSSDLQTRVIGLLAQLALSMVVAHPQDQSEREEARHVEQAANPQNPS